jgi:DNA-binding transcriptional ArsR family regulator
MRSDSRTTIVAAAVSQGPKPGTASRAPFARPLECAAVAGTGDTCDLLCLDLPKAERLRAQRPPARELEEAAAAAAALGDPTRLQVAIALRDGGELCVCDLAWVCERSDKLVSHHARALRTAGLVTSRRDGKMALYSLTDAGRALLDTIMFTAGRA